MVTYDIQQRWQGHGSALVSDTAHRKGCSSRNSPHLAQCTLWNNVILKVSLRCEFSQEKNAKPKLWKVHQHQSISLSSKSYLTPEEDGRSLQNLMVSLISCGMNLPSPLLRGAFSRTQPRRRKEARLDITKQRDRNKSNSRFLDSQNTFGF